jgi:hypothetical protein
MDQYTEAAQRFTQIWTDFAGKVASAGMAFQPDNAPPDVARRMRDAMLAAMASYAEQFMRTPEFMEMMKQSMQASLDLRKQLNDFLTRAHHGAQGVARQDVDAVMAAIRHMETRALDRLEALSRRVEELSERLEALEGRGRGEPPPAGPRGSGPRKRGRGGR